MKRYTLTMYRSDMGSFKQPGCTSWEDALWHVNSARDHDGLAHIDLDELKGLSRTRKGSTEWATITKETKP